MSVATGSNVKVHYTGTFDDGEVFDSSREREPMEFEVGAQQVIPGFDQAVIGMEIGESKQVKIPEEEAYGAYNPEMVMEVTPDQFEEGMKVEVGQQFQVEMGEGNQVVLMVKEVLDDKVVLDANHPMAGKTLNFDIELVEIA
ncbi:MAG TPA: peptidylprolyl isomerase [Geopsychrobacteraceae bacterium]|nr:peptidylprolyl isomerase [Geopsychrobacteraceae bacterium]